jgi:hypothetical protein
MSTQDPAPDTREDAGTTPGASAAPRVGFLRRLKKILLMRVTRREPTRRQRGVAILVVLVTTAVIAATASDFAYSTQVEIEAAANSRDRLRAEYLARAGLQLGQLLTAVQGSVSGMLAQVMPDLADAIVITDYAGFLAKAFGGDKEARDGLGGLIGIDLGNAEGMGTPAGTSFDVKISSEEGKWMINCGGGVNPTRELQRSLYLLLYNMVRPQRYDRMFNKPDRDGVMVTREELPLGIIDWADVDPMRFDPLSVTGTSSANEDRYDKGRDTYEAHNHYFDTLDELLLVRGVSDDFYLNFGEMFTVYGGPECTVLAQAIPPESWPLVAAMIAASAVDKSAVFEPNTLYVAQQVAGMLRGGLTMLKQLPAGMSPKPCDVDLRQCPNAPKTPTPTTGTTKTAATTTASSSTIDTLSNLICSPLIAQLPTMSESLALMTGQSAPPKLSMALRPIPLCPGMLAKFLRDKGTSNPVLPPGAPPGGTPPPSKTATRRFFRIDASGIVARGANKTTEVHVRGVWDTRATNYNPICTNHQSCYRGTWKYYRID